MQLTKYAFQAHGDGRGNLVALEELKNIPFKVKRVYYIYDTKSGVRRGFHAHKHLTMEAKRKKYCLTTLLWGCILQIICGAKCMIFLRMPFFWC